MYRLMWLAIQERPLLALKAIWWLATRRRVRGRAALVRAASSHSAYYDWAVRQVEADEWARGGAEPSSIKPMFILDTCRTSTIEESTTTVDSIQAAFGDVDTIVLQEHAPYSMPGWDPRLECLSTHDLVGKLKVADVPVIFMRCGDLMSRLAGRALSDTWKRAARGTVVFWDEDRVRSGRRTDVWLKPRWNRLQFLSQDFMSFACAIPSRRVATALLKARGPKLDVPMVTAFALLGQADGPVEKIDLALTHRGPEFCVADKRQEALAQLAPEFRVEPQPRTPVARVTRPLVGGAPSLTIIIPTRDSLNILEPCVNGMIAAEYPGQKDIIIVDNGSRDRETLEFLKRIEDQGVKVLRDDAPFNYSALNNAAVETTTSELLCFMNNDVEPVDNDWLTVLAGFAVDDRIGAVGAKLLYPDGSVQHAGVAIGLGDAAGHVLRGTDDNPSIAHGLIWATRYSAAVTAACLVVSKRKFLEVGGFNEVDLAVAFNDVDLCLKLRERGYENVFAPAAVLVHHESKSRGLDHSGEKRRRFKGELDYLQRRWRTKEKRDPYLHPWCSRTDESLSFSPW